MTNDERVKLVQEHLGGDEKGNYDGLLPNWLREALPPLYSQENAETPMVFAKFFNPCGPATWYIMEFDGDDTFFGYADLGYLEYEYMSLREFQETKLRFGLNIERDLYFKPMPASEVVKIVSEGGRV